MPKIWERKYARDSYHSQLGWLIDFGNPVEARGRKFMEQLDAITVVNEPWHHCILLADRHWNPWLAMSEFLWIMAGRNDVAALYPYNKNIISFSDDGETLYGAYGKRIYNQIDDLIERLRKDPSDRRAVLQIWEHHIALPSKSDFKDCEHFHHDLTSNSKDPPCNNMVYFKLRENKLHMTVICRSNDIHWGLYAVNLPTFGMLQVYLAARLGVEVGTQTHLSNSLHVYTDDERAKAITDRMLYKTETPWPPYPKHEKIFEDLTWVDSHKQFSEKCSQVLDLANESKEKIFTYNYITTPSFLLFAINFLWSYKNKSFNSAEFMQKWPEYADWITAGDIFVDKVWKRESRSI